MTHEGFWALRRLRENYYLCLSDCFLRIDHAKIGSCSRDKHIFLSLRAGRSWRPSQSPKIPSNPSEIHRLNPRTFPPFCLLSRLLVRVKLTEYDAVTQASPRGESSISGDPGLKPHLLIEIIVGLYRFFSRRSTLLLLLLLFLLAPSGRSVREDQRHLRLARRDGVPVSRKGIHLCRRKIVSSERRLTSSSWGGIINQLIKASILLFPLNTHRFSYKTQTKGYVCLFSPLRWRAWLTHGFSFKTDFFFETPSK